MEVDSSQSSLNSVWPDPAFKCPKVLITVALEEEQWLQTGSFVEWLKAVPALAKFARVEGVYHSDSTLMIASIPVAVWDVLPKTPALGFIGFVRSYNVLSEVVTQAGNPVPERVTEPFESKSVRTSPPVRFDQGMAEETARSPAGSSKAGLATPPSTFHGSIYSTPQMSQTGRPIGTRGTKAPVALPCVNCKKQHLRCDMKRPCNQCVKAGNIISARLALSSLITMSVGFLCYCPT